jgi:hypothetical protein
MRNIAILVGFLGAAGLGACGSSAGNQCPASSDGGPVTGAADTHCMGQYIAVDPSMCMPPDGGPVDMADFGPTNYGTEADDDDCKYHVKWTSTPICEGGDVTFTVTITHAIDGTPVTGAAPNIEAFSTVTHPAPDVGKPTEMAGGVYAIGPVHFDQPGMWTVRFHIDENCHDTAASPHGHAAFFVGVP